MAVWPSGTIAKHVVLAGSLVVKNPEPWSFEQAADTPIEIPTSTASDDLAKVEASVNRQELSLDMEAAYLLTGGFGGLGMALVYRLVEHSARTLVIISRSAGQSNESKKFILEMASLGCSIIAVSGKVNSQEDVERAVAEVGRPIKGVVHMAMVLRVNSVP